MNPGKVASFIGVVFCCNVIGFCYADTREVGNIRLDIAGHVEPTALRLECDDEVVNTTEQQFIAISTVEPCRSLTCKMQGVADAIGGESQDNSVAIKHLEELGYERTDETKGGQKYARFNVPVKFQFKTRFKLELGMELDPGPDILGFHHQILSKTKQSKTQFFPDETKDIITSESKGKIESIAEHYKEIALRWVNDVLPQLEIHDFFSEKEISQMISNPSGTVQRRETINFCEKKYDILYIWEWQHIGTASDTNKGADYEW